MNSHWIRNFALALAGALLLAATGAGAAARQKTYGSPDEAVKDLIAATRSHDQKAMLAALGPEAKALVYSGDSVADRAAQERFVKAYDEANKLDPQGDAKAVLSVGKDNWPFPIPLVKAGEAWRFDSTQGAEELLNRRIGRNELSAMQAMQAYVDAQREYYLLNPMKDRLLQYAQRVGSAKGKRDGLYFPTRAGEPPSPLGALFERRAAAGYKNTPDKSSPYFGYRYRILKAQGPDAKGGAYDYVVRGKMIGGFALVAYPASYGGSGIMTFIVSHEGVVYQKDLGPGTSAIASKMTKFNPDASWKRQ
jgi:hypothetical protein